MPVVSAIHDPLRKVDPGSSDVCRIVYVANLVDRSAMNDHSQLQLRILFQILADLDRTPHGGFRTVKKNESLAITQGELDRLPCFFGTADLLCPTNDFSQLFQVLTL